MRKKFQKTPCLFHNLFSATHKIIAIEAVSFSRYEAVQQIAFPMYLCFFQIQNITKSTAGPC